MICDLRDTILERQSPLLYEPVVEPPERVFLGYRGNDDAGVVEREGFVEPEEVGVAAEDGEGGFGEEGGGGLVRSRMI